LKGFVLIVEDEPTVVRHLRSLLSALGYQSGFVSRGSLLQSRLQEGGIDLILLDYHLSDTDAEAVLEELDLETTPPVIVMTADRNESLLGRCLESGAVDFLLKPVQLATLHARVESVLNQRRYLTLLNDHRQELERMVRERTQELENSNASLDRLNRAFAKFVPGVFLDHILKQESVEAGFYEEREVTLLFCDVRSYTTLAEQLGSRKTLAMLNQIFATFEEPLSRHGAVIDQFIGDAMLAFFVKDAGNPIDCAIEMQRAMCVLNRERRDRELPEVQVGIGLNTGEVMLGAIGHRQRLSSTVIGDHVNLASRIESLTVSTNSRILISESTWATWGNGTHRVRPVDRLRVKGKHQPVEIHEIYSADLESIRDAKDRSTPVLREGFEHFRRRDFESASVSFRASMVHLPQDPICTEHLRRCYALLRSPPGENWDGTVDLLRLQPQQRRFFRQAVQVPPRHVHLASVRSADGRPQQATITNVSDRGVGLEMEHPIEVGTLVEIHIQLDDTAPSGLSGKSIILVTQAVWCRQRCGAHHVGLELLFSPVEDEKDWLCYIKTLSIY